MKKVQGLQDSKAQAEKKKLDDVTHFAPSLSPHFFFLSLSVSCPFPTQKSNLQVRHEAKKKVERIKKEPREARKVLTKMSFL